jgi:hypothetical protein
VVRVDPAVITDEQPQLTIVPLTQREAIAYVEQHHRHHKPSRGDVFRVGVADESGDVRGLAMVGRPVARHLDDGWTLEVTRVATDGCPNACSALYGAAWRAARALGWRKLITYTLSEEGGASLRGAGWREIGSAGGGSWDCRSRPRVDTHPTQMKIRWEAG